MLPIHYGSTWRMEHWDEGEEEGKLNETGKRWYLLLLFPCFYNREYKTVVQFPFDCTGRQLELR